MKKLLISLICILFANFSMANINKNVADTIRFVDVVEINNGEFGVVWTTDSVKCDAYKVDMVLFDTATYTGAFFATVATYAENYVISNSSYYGVTTSNILKYGDNYQTIGAKGASQEVIDAWETAWNNSVNENGETLKPGYYIIQVTGIDSMFNVIAAANYIMVNVKNVTTDINSVFFNKKANGKYMDPITNTLYIIRDDKKYNIQGNRIK